MCRELRMSKDYLYSRESREPTKSREPREAKESIERQSREAAAEKQPGIRRRITNFYYKTVKI